MGQLPNFQWIHKKVTFFIVILDYPVDDFGLFWWKVSILCSFRRNFCWGGWSFAIAGGLCLCQFEEDLVVFVGIENYSLYRWGFLHCFDCFWSWIFLGRKHVLLIVLLMWWRFCGFLWSVFWDLDFFCWKPLFEKLLNFFERWIWIFNNLQRWKLKQDEKQLMVETMKISEISTL